MAAVIIGKKDVEKLGKDLLKEVFNFFHNEYIMNNFLEMKLQKQKFLKDLVYKEFKNYHYTEKQSGNSWEFSYEKYDESKFEEDLKSIPNKVKDGSIATSIIFETLNNLDLDMEIDEDLYFKTKAFLNLYRVIDCDYRYL